MEQGADNVSLTVKAFVKNNGEAADVVLGIVALVLSRLKVEQANKKLRAELAEGGHDENPLVVG